jgi:hypothetical protein
MRRLMIALVWLAGLTLVADAGVLRGADLAGAAKTTASIVNVACTYPDRYCPYGTTRVCSGYRCYCAACRSYPPYAYSYRPYAYPYPYYYAPYRRPGVSLYFGF